MSDGNFQHEFGDELLSAYLDDELARDERADVEARLASDPSAQQLLHQLKSVSESVQRLPLAAAGPRVRENILRRVAELTPAGETTTEEVVRKPSAHSSIGAVEVMPKPAIFQTRRAWIWASLAVAAGLAIMVLEPGEFGRDGDVDQVAQRAPAPKAGVELHERGDGSSIEDIKLKTEADRSKLAVADVVIPPPPGKATSPAAKPAPSREPLPESPANSAGRAQEVVELYAANAPAMPKDAAPQASRATAEAVSVPPSDSVKGEAADKSRLADLGRQASPPAGVSNAPAPAPAPGGAIPAVSGKAGGAPEAARFARGAGPEKVAPGAMARSQSGEPAATLGGELGFKGLALSKRAREAEPALVVYVAASPEAFRTQAFNQLLARHGIELEPLAPVDGEGRAGGAASGPVPPKAGNEVSQRTLEEARAHGNEQVDVVLVEAPKTQILSCLAELSKDATTYAGVEIEERGATDVPAAPEGKAAADEQALTELKQYNRGRVAERGKELGGWSYFERDSGAAAEYKIKSSAADRLSAETDLPETLSELRKKSHQPSDTDKARGTARARRLTRAETESTPVGGTVDRDVTKQLDAIEERSEELPESRRAFSESESVAKSDAETLRVLFVLSPVAEPATAASAPAEKSAE